MRHRGLQKIDKIIGNNAKCVISQLRAMAQLSELSCDLASRTRLAQDTQSTQEFQRLLPKPLGKSVDHERRLHLPNSRCSQQPEEARFTQLSLPQCVTLNNPCCRQCHNPTPDFHNSLSTTNCATRPTPDIVPANRLDHVGEGRQQTLHHKALKRVSGDAKPLTPYPQPSSSSTSSAQSSSCCSRYPT